MDRRALTQKTGHSRTPPSWRGLRSRPATGTTGVAARWPCPGRQARSALAAAIVARPSLRRCGPSAGRRGWWSPRCGARPPNVRARSLRRGTARSSAYAAGSRRSSRSGGAATASVARDGSASPRPLSSFPSPPLPATSEEPPTSSPPPEPHCTIGLPSGPSWQARASQPTTDTQKAGSAHRSLYPDPLLIASIKPCAPAGSPRKGRSRSSVFFSPAGTS